MIDMAEIGQALQEVRSINRERAKLLNMKYHDFMESPTAELDLRGLNQEVEEANKALLDLLLREAMEAHTMAYHNPDEGLEDEDDEPETPIEVPNIEYYSTFLTAVLRYLQTKPSYTTLKLYKDGSGCIELNMNSYSDQKFMSFNNLSEAVSQIRKALS